jgi:predicted TIM-barrel fold metal-dependent hydrolase
MLSRRQFVSTTFAASVALPSQKVIAQPAKRIIVDSQVHLWKAESEDWKWVPGMKPQMPEPFTIEKLVPLMDQAGLDRVVVVPPSWPGDRNDYALEAVKRYPNRIAVMGRIALQNRQSTSLLPKWMEQPGMLGVRVTFLSDITITWLTEGTADWFWPAAEKAEVPVMFLAPGQISMFARIAERHPQLTLIIGHMGLNSSSRTGRITAIRQRLIRPLRSPNIRTLASSCRVRRATRSKPIRSAT